MRRFYFYLIACFVLLACNKEDKIVLPILEELPKITDETYTSAVIHGTLIEVGNQPILKHGFVWRKEQLGTPTLDNSEVIYCEGTLDGKTFSHKLTGLKETEHYEVRSFIETKQQIIYSEDSNIFMYCRPIIENTLPKEGVGGTIVTIIGKNFTTKKDAIEIKINGIKAVIKEASENKILFEVPENIKGGINYRYELTVFGRSTTGPFKSKHYFSLEENYITVAHRSRFDITVSVPIMYLDKNHKPDLDFIVNGKRWETIVEFPIGDNFEGYEVTMRVPDNLKLGKARVSVKMDYPKEIINFVDKSKGLTILPAGSWLKKNNFTNANNSPLGFKYRNVGYLVDEYAMYQYQLDSDTWKLIKRFNYSTKRLAVIDDKLYMMTYSGEFFLYNLETKNIQSLAKFPKNVTNQSLFSVGGELYFGWNDKMDKSLWKYDFEKREWIKKASFPGKIEKDFSFAILDDKVRVENYIYHPKSDTYEKHEEIIKCGRNPILLNNKFYSCECSTYWIKDGLKNEIILKNQMKYYDLELKHKISDEYPPFKQNKCRICFEINGKLYVTVGSNRFYEFIPAR